MTLPQDVTRLQSEMRAAVRQHWKAFLIEGILLMILGLAAIIVPPLASLAVTIFLGWMFLIAGIAGLVLTFWARQMPGFWWSLISAILAIGAGIILLAKPVSSPGCRARRNGRSDFWSASISCSAAHRWSAWRSLRATPDSFAVQQPRLNWNRLP